MTATFFQRPWICTNRSYFFSGISLTHSRRGNNIAGRRFPTSPKCRACRRRPLWPLFCSTRTYCMENDTRTIEEVVKTERDLGGEEIAIVRCSDGTLGVARDGKLIET